jgi:hypothetical protein
MIVKQLTIPRREIKLCHTVVSMSITFLIFFSIISSLAFLRLMHSLPCVPRHYNSHFLLWSFHFATLGYKAPEA